MADIVTFNVGSSSIEVRTSDGRVETEKELDVEDLGSTARGLARRVGVDASTTHVHRVVHGGDMASPKRLTNDVKDEIRFHSRFASLHNPAELDVIRAVQDLTGRPGYAVFDTSFHQTIPEYRRAYGLPEAFHDAGIKQYGFHGISVRGACKERSGNIVCCHLGSGCSVTAVHDGDSVATSMGLTPFDGCLMRTRPGRLDPGVVLELCKHDSVENVDAFLNEEAGWTGMSNDKSLKALVNEEPDGRVVNAFVSSVAEEIHRVCAALPSVDVLIFTGGVGENNAEIRRRVCEAASLLEVDIDMERNSRGDGVVSTPSSPIEVCVIEADEAATMIRIVEDYA